MVLIWNKGLTPLVEKRRFRRKFMAENIPGGPTGAIPPKKETGKVQPKKETVRINLPPKPSAAPTIKLPTLPPGGPPTGGGLPPAAPAAPAPAAAPAAPRAAAAPVAAARPAATASSAPRATMAPVAAPARLSPVDQILAIAAAVIGLAAVATTIWMWQL